MHRSNDRSGHRPGAPRGQGRRAPHHPRPRPAGDGSAARGRDPHEPSGADRPERARSSEPAEQADDAPAGGGFAALGLCEMLLRAVAQEGYSEPTPIQRKAIPHVLAGRDLFGCAQTGTGKTAAFALPIIERLAAERRTAAPKRCRVLVLAPTRELAAQIHDAFRAYGRHAHLKTAVIYGGVNQNPQARALARGVDVLVATPGRLLDLVGQRLADLVDTEVLVLDEADRMLDMGFIHDVRRIVGLVPRRRQTLFFSATLPAEVRDLADAMLRDPLEVKTAPQATPAETVAQSVFHVAQKQKKALLVHLLAAGAMPRVIVFTRTKRGANKLAEDLVKSGVNAAAIHGNKSQNQREKALADFKGPRPPVLVATDIAARGIDVDEVSHVVNYELPHEPETYVHRIGRTGRAGLTGEAIAFCDREERERLDAIERLLRREIPVRGDLPADLPKVEAAAHGGRPAGGPRPQGGRPGGRGGRPGRSGRPDGGRAGSARGAGSRRGGGAGAGGTQAPAPQFREATGGAPEAPRPQGGSKVSRRYRRAL